MREILNKLLSNFISRTLIKGVALLLIAYTALAGFKTYAYACRNPEVMSNSFKERQTWEEIVYLAKTDFYDIDEVISEIEPMLTNDSYFATELDDKDKNDIYEKTLKFMAVLNTKFLEKYHNNGWRVEFDEDMKNISKYGGHKSTETSLLYGVSIPSEKRIVINLKRGCESTILHEMGHYLDYETNASQTESFKKIVNNEKYSGYISQTNSGNSYKEYFAEGFRMSLMYPDETKEKAPETYSYIMSVYNAYSN